MKIIVLLTSDVESGGMKIIVLLTSKRAACGIVRVVRHPIWLMQRGVNLERFMLVDHQASAGCRPVWPDWWDKFAGPFGPELVHVCWRSVKRSAFSLLLAFRFTPI